MTFLDLMEIEISRAGKPLTIREALTFAELDGNIKELPHIGKTPQKTMNSALHKDILKGNKARFKQISDKPATFDIKRDATI